MGPVSKFSVRAAKKSLKEGQGREVYKFFPSLCTLLLEKKGKRRSTLSSLKLWYELRIQKISCRCEKYCTFLCSAVYCTRTGRHNTVLTGEISNGAVLTLFTAKHFFLLFRLFNRIC